MQFGAEPLFENISAKFGNGNRYGLIGANGCGKSTFMKILSGVLAPSAGNVSITPGLKVGTLSQDQFAFEQYSVIDAVIMGDTALWEIKQERDRIYSLPEMSEEDGMTVAELEGQACAGANGVGRARLRNGVPIPRSRRPDDERSGCRLHRGYRGVEVAVGQRVRR